MFHFPSTLQQGLIGTSRRSDKSNLNATQQKQSAHLIFVKVEEELHDARRVHADGQEDDLRYALNMVIDRVTELSSMLSEAYKAQAELEIQLNVAKSNLKLVIANNEMLEDALKQTMSTQSKDVGWNRTNRPISTTLATLSRPGTPSGQHFNSPNSSHLTSPSLPSLSSVKSKELEVLTAELEKEKASRKKIKEEKAALEAELESLSQALFEEANKMVSDERRLRAEMEDELNELKTEKEALKSALRLVAGEGNTPDLDSIISEDRLTPVATETLNSHSGSTHSRSSSQIGLKSRPPSLELALLYPLPPSPAPHSESHAWQEGFPDEETLSKVDETSSMPTVLSPNEQSQPTPRFRPPISGTVNDMFIGVSPWADAVSSHT